MKRYNTYSELNRAAASQPDYVDYRDDEYTGSWSQAAEMAPAMGTAQGQLVGGTAGALGMAFGLPPEQAVKLAEMGGQFGGAYGMAGGQFLDQITGAGARRRYDDKYNARMAQSQAKIQAAQDAILEAKMRRGT